MRRSGCCRGDAFTQGRLIEKMFDKEAVSKQMASFLLEDNLNGPSILHGVLIPEKQ